MRIPDDWDKSSPENIKLCHRFGSGSFTYGSRTFPYRYYSPKSESYDGGGFPVVLYLHGADAVGDDNEQPLAMHDIGTVLATDEWQRSHPCFILAPQYRKSMHWGAPDMQNMLFEFIKDFTSQNPDTDMRRIYVYGYSAGGIGTLELIKSYPFFFAGAIVICGATYDKDTEKLTYTPMWLFHAEDDNIVPCGDRCFLPIENTYLGSRPLFNKLHPIVGDHVRYTEYPRGWMKKNYGINAHCSWVPVSQNKECWEWLFLQQK